ncbi:MAG: hypothetical protein J0L86_15260 [Flavobacteriales bacterium]|nr:hypothetical protein [Flavobacteriales bacterium]
MTKKNIFSIALVLFFIFIIAKAIIFNIDRNSLRDKKELFTVGEITDYSKGAKVSPWFLYQFSYKNQLIKGESIIEGKLRKADNKKLSSYIGKKYFVKFSTVKSKYSEIYLNKPVPNNFVYEEGQSWKEIPVKYE